MTSYQLDWPIMSGSRFTIPASRGSWAITRATACSSVVTGPSSKDGAELDNGAAAPAHAVEAAKNWARSWRPEIQGYLHAYRAVTGMDLTNAEMVDHTMPAIHLQKRLAMQRAR